MATFSTPFVTGAPVAVVQTAQAIVDEYRTNGGGSNRSDWGRTIAMLAAVLDVAYGRGVPVELTDRFASYGASSPYHLAHRVLSGNLFAEHWDRVQVVALRNVTRNGSEMTGETDTVRGTVLLLCPVQ
jgi:hypothetical protein